MQVGQALMKRGWPITVAGKANAELLNRADAAGLRTISFPYRRDFDWATIRAASRWIRDNRPEAVLVTTGRDIRTVGLAARWHRVPVVWRMGPKPKHNLIHRVTGSLIDRVIAPSDNVRYELATFPWLEGKVDVIHNGITLVPEPTAEEIKLTRESLGIADQQFLCLYVGRLMTGKGIDTLIDSFVDVHRRCPEAILWIVGTGPDEAMAKERCRALGLDRIVTFVGYKPDPSPYFNACDLFLLPSRYESFSYVLLEAMLRSKPCIATRAGAIPEVAGEEAVLLIPPDDPQALADAVVKLQADSQRRTEMGEQGRERVTKHFDLGRTVDHVQELLSTLIARSKAA